jgi:phosphoglycolate phosphatase
LEVPEAIFFDLDGTLIDSLPDLAVAVNCILAKLGFSGHEPSVYRECIGDGARALVERVLPAEVASDARVVDKALGLYQDFYGAGWRERTQVYPGIARLLAELESRRVVTGVISNKPHGFTKLCVEHFFPKNRFRVVLGQREEVPKKPDPTVGFEAMRLAGVSASCCAYVGDSGIDMRFANATGMAAIGVTWGFRGTEELRNQGAHAIVSSIEELGDLFCK